MPFRLEHITLADRMELGCRCLLDAHQYGLVTQLAREHGTSRQFLYDLRDRAQSALEIALSARMPGRPTLDQRLVVDQNHVERSILVLNQVAYASVRSVQVCLEELLEVRRSLGSIEAVLTEAARRAEALVVVPRQGGPLQLGPLVADEIYAAEQPVLGVVDHRSGAVLALEKADSADETTWGCALLDLAARVGPIADLTTDGGNGLRAGVKAAGMPEPGLDHWHSLRELGRVCRALEEDAYRRLRLAQRSQKAAQIEAYRAEHQGRRPRPGQPLKAPSDPLSVAKAQAESEQAIWRFDSARIVFETVAEVLGPLDPRTGRIRRPLEVLADLGAGAGLLRELGGLAAHAARVLEERAESLVGYLVALETALGPSRAVLGEAVVTFLAWAWQYRAELGLADAAAAWPEAPEEAGRVWRALDAAVRATGMAENLNSLLAFHRATHRGLPDKVLALFKVYRNHHVFSRGKRAGQSPLELLGLPSPHWLDALGYAKSASKGILPPNITQSVNTLAA